MKVEPKDLRAGDEILVGRGGLKYYRLLRTPKLRRNSTDRWSMVKCSTRIDMIPHISTWGGKSHTYNTLTYVLTSEGHNTEQYVDLNYKNIWRVKEAETI